VFFFLLVFYADNLAPDLPLLTKDTPP